MKQGLFITVEGTDGSGKTTQIGLMRDYLQEVGYNVVLTREPGGTNISEKIRGVLLDPENDEMGKIAEMLLYAAARAQLVHQVIKPAVAQGRIVICDRFVDSSLVYQGFGRGIPLETVTGVNNVALDGLMPDITFFFDLNPEIALKRRVDSTGADRIEKEKIEFHRKVYEGYKKLASLYPERIHIIDSTRSISEIAGEVREQLGELLGMYN
jgi:dTMP kinase